MLSHGLVLFCFLYLVQADFGFNNGFMPISSQSSLFNNQASQQFGNSAGNAAAAGNAGSLGFGSSSSINQANHQADQFNTASNSLSANTAQGEFGSQASGAANAGGNVQFGANRQSSFGLQQGTFGSFRRRRDVVANIDNGQGQQVAIAALPGFSSSSASSSVSASNVPGSVGGTFLNANQIMADQLRAVGLSVGTGSNGSGFNGQRITVLQSPNANAASTDEISHVSDPVYPHAKAQTTSIPGAYLQHTPGLSVKKMYLRLVTLACCLIAVRANFQNQNQGQFNNGGFPNNGFNNGGFNNGFNNGGGFAGQNQAFKNLAIQQQGAAQGNSAAAGNAGAQGLGSASSINQADHQADQGNTRSQSLSANTAQGTQGSSAGGAAQAGGQVQNAKQIQSSMGQLNNFQRFKRHYGGYDNYGYNGFPVQNQANANAIGGGSALFGQVGTHNLANTQTGLYGSNGFATGDAFGQGQGVNIYQASSSNVGSGYLGRRKRQVFGNWGGPQSNALSNSLGGGSAFHGRVWTQNNAVSNTNPYSGFALGAGNAGGEGNGVNIWNAANSQTNSGFNG
ncbi:hypothetical protein BV898_00240 [Hypsibius exemplaris]|uniref:Uncharacterized protein n=1 Tax=Hypsibius exemplaris TaxID=2072580 RepID=A0A1W0XF64_HYPEX|nr:hypothetical protein BV898_00240 [Hypsibius exemplaris]